MTKTNSQVYDETLPFLQSLGYFLDGSVWIHPEYPLGFVVTYNSISIGLMVYDSNQAESGYVLYTGNSLIAQRFIQNIHFINEAFNNRQTICS
ncbi:hypothetical protein ACQ4M3_35260 [Leptolyngbya sp. AN03gr2]|uniref:hypothetical protein n=1 Tax=unclassified Leptolyngbya TaxID=2650499 RepID=UPI003D31969A